MKAKKRYSYLLCSTSILLSTWWFCSSRQHSSQNPTLPNSLNAKNSVKWNERNFSLPTNISFCTMQTCFNMSRCLKSFKFTVYPLYDEHHNLRKYFKTDKWQMSKLHEKILNILKKSRYYTADIDHACIFILSFDILDRDTLSENFIPHLDNAIANLPMHLWNNGINHLIFNLYAGTWPDYNTRDLGANLGYAMMAKASFAIEDFRSFYDISLPLFSSSFPETLDDLYSEETSLQRCKISSSLALRGYSRQRYLLTFKGKRYVHGIGSDSRNAIYHLHNDRDVIILTTCKHGKNWEKMKDERCDIDNANYEKFDYDELMENSTFCLIPRGRRLGSYRFIEALKFGCIPVILADGFVPPFSEVLDWNLAAVTADERRIFQLTDYLRSFSAEKVKRMRQHVRLFYRSYFSSIESIISTTLEIIKYRVKNPTSTVKSIWSERLGGIWSYLPNAQFDPMFIDKPLPTMNSYTIIVNLFKPFHGYLLRMKNLLSDLSKLEAVEKIYVLVHFSKMNEILSKHILLKIEILTKDMKTFGVFYGFTLKIDSPYLVVLDASSYFKAKDVKVAMELFSSRKTVKIVGYCALDEIWDETDQYFKIIDACNNSCYSLVSDTLMVTHRLQRFLNFILLLLEYFFDWLSAYSSVSSLNKDNSPCMDLILNSIINEFGDDHDHLTRDAERIIRGLNTICTTRQNGLMTSDQTTEHSRRILLSRKQKCFDNFLNKNQHLRLGRRFCHTKRCN